MMHLRAGTVAAVVVQVGNSPYVVMVSRMGLPLVKHNSKDDVHMMRVLDTENRERFVRLPPGGFTMLRNEEDEGIRIAYQKVCL